MACFEVGREGWVSSQKPGEELGHYGLGMPSRWHMFCFQALFEGRTFATVVRQYLTFQKWLSEKAEMICFGPVSNLWNDAQLPIVSDAVLEEETLC